jgi:hypothetical protein
MNDESTHSQVVDRKICISEPRDGDSEAAGGEMSEWESSDCPPEVAEQYWGNVLAYESASDTCHFNQLEELGIEPPPSEELDDAQVSAKLWEVIGGQAKLNVLLLQTSHLSDRELCEHLWHDSLREFTADLPPDFDWRRPIDLLSSGSDEDNELYLKFYADDEWREHWRREFPIDTIPPHVDPPYDRHSKLPTAAH